VAIEHKQSVRARFNQLAVEAGAHQPEELANAMLLLNVAKVTQQLIDGQCGVKKV